MLRAGVWHAWRRYTPLITGIRIAIITVFGLAVPTVLHATVGVYGLCLLAMAVALYTDPTPAAAPTLSQPPAAASMTTASLLETRSLW